MAEVETILRVTCWKMAGSFSGPQTFMVEDWTYVVYAGRLRCVPTVGL